jgi:uncharacterized membrane protein
MNRVRVFGLIGLVGALWGLLFAVVSSMDYASHLDRSLHDLHCSFIPGVEAMGDSEGCRTALNSPYSALFKQRLWGGIPISLFGVGCFAFLLGHAAYITLRGERASRAAGLLYFGLACSPALVSVVMFSISWFELGSVCKTCMGIYIGSAILAVSAFGVAAGTWSNGGSITWAGATAAALALAALLVWTLVPSVVYAALAPDQSELLGQCGQIKNAKEEHDALIALPGRSPQRNGLFFEDPLCPTCKSLHQRLADAGVLDRLDIQLALFPLDSECNWMLDRPLHPGACQVSRAVLCAKAPGLVLDWAYENQSALAEAGKAGAPQLTKLIRDRWGADVVRCMSDRNTTLRLNRHLHFAAGNAIAVSTPQVFIDGQRLCDEDIDIGLMYALHELAPELLP